MVNSMLQCKWLHIHIFKGELFVFADDGHWKDSLKNDWDNSIETTFDAIDKECYIGNIDYMGELRVRILLNPTIRYGKFGMPYVEEA